MKLYLPKQGDIIKYFGKLIKNNKNDEEVIRYISGGFYALLLDDITKDPILFNSPVSIYYDGEIWKVFSKFLIKID
jgi:hypothetical protein